MINLEILFLLKYLIFQKSSLRFINLQLIIDYDINQNLILYYNKQITVVFTLFDRLV